MWAKPISFFLFILMTGGLALAQKNKQPIDEKLTMKTVRLHIDGFTKSKSGAV
ncbi:MAG: hypothetical protein JNK38_00260 [Acidobacteria bacterium]|nr:hypothetical protein [Acidobacteriota bacterium]